jgi:hypothetical protein
MFLGLIAAVAVVLVLAAGAGTAAGARIAPAITHGVVVGDVSFLGIFPNMDFDRTLNPERLAFFGPSSPGAVTSWGVAKHWFNFGELAFSRDGSLTMRIINTANEIQFERTLAPGAAG